MAVSYTHLDVYKRQELEAVGLAAPQVTYLMHELAAAGIPVSMDATTVAEAKEEILAKLGR